MRELEKYCCDYVILGIPQKPFTYFLGFLIKKGVRPTVYAPKANLVLKASGLAKFCISDSFMRDGVIFDFLERHATIKARRKLSLIVKDDYFNRFVKKNAERLEKLFIIQEDTVQETSNEA